MIFSRNEIYAIFIGSRSIPRLRFSLTAVVLRQRLGDLILAGTQQTPFPFF